MRLYWIIRNWFLARKYARDMARLQAAQAADPLDGIVPEDER